MPSPGQRPLQVWNPPRPIQVTHDAATRKLSAFAEGHASQSIHQVWGPERIETAWWRGPSVRRDYYRVECQDGARYWLFYDLTGRLWYLHGAFM